MRSETTEILVVDDRSSIRQVLQATFASIDFAVVCAGRGEEALSLVRLKESPAVLLDINMPGMSGIETCRQMRRIDPGLSILMLTVCDCPDDKINALDAGADDFITKPFHVGELGARLRASVRHSAPSIGISDSSIRVGEIELHPQQRVVSKAGTLLQLTPREFDLLHYLMANVGRPIRHAKLLTSIWGDNYGSELEYLRTFVCQIRKKLEDDASKPRYLLTEPYIGYRFSDLTCLTQQSA